MSIPVFFFSSFAQSPSHIKKKSFRRLAALFALAAITITSAAQAQTANRLPQGFDQAPVSLLADHHPLWASNANDLGPLGAGSDLENLTLVLARSPEQQKAFDQLLEDQQNPASPEYHHWLTPIEIGARFGVSEDDIASISGWLRDQGLHVNWVSPSRIFIGFGGPATSVGRAFGTEMHSYSVKGEERVSVSSDPMLPSALAPVILAVRGLFTIQELPQHRSHIEMSDRPDLTVGNSPDFSYFIAPGDFDTIYDVDTSFSYPGSGVTIGIVAESRTDKADFDNFKLLTDASFADPTEVVPTAYGGADPGAAFTSPPSCETATPPTCTNAVNEQIDAQGEATLDVLRSGSVAPDASLLLVVASGLSGGIADDAQYLTGTTPVPAQIMSISFGGCESESGASDVTFWNGIYQNGVAEGISIFVASGDGGAAGCDQYFSPPPANPAPISPNALCSPQYDTCVGGTEFNDTSDLSKYWNSSNYNSGSGLGSALSYIPEGAWNEPGDATDGFVVAATGGGVSQYVATPTWQTGTGVPAARTGRYTPDVSFSAAGHDAYLGCLSAIQAGSCVPVTTPQGQEIPFVSFEGTSAAAPSMAGVAALLDETYLGPQGNITPAIYKVAASFPSAFHDVTVATSGVASCSVGTPSMCNNSVPGPASLTVGAEAGYLVQTGYDEATGWGSLDINKFLNDYGAGSGKIVPTVQVTPSAASITTTQPLNVTVTLSGGSGNPTPTGTVTLTGGGYTSSAATLASGAATFSIPANSLAPGNDTLTVSYTPDSTSLATYWLSTGVASVAVSIPNPTAPAISIQAPGPITTKEELTVIVTATPNGTYPAPSGTVTLTGGSYNSGAQGMIDGMAIIYIQAGTLPLGVNTLSASYTPDATGALYYVSASQTITVTVDPVQTPTITVSPASTTVTSAQSLQVTVTLGATAGFPAPAGSLILTSGSYSSNYVTLQGGAATITIPTETLAAGTDTLTAAYASSDLIYHNEIGTATVTVTTVPDFTLSASPASVSVAEGATGTSTVTIAPLNGFTGTVAFTAANLPYGVTTSFAEGTTSDSEVVTFSATASAATGTQNVTITGTSGSVTRTTTVGVEVTPGPAFGSLNGGQGSLTVSPGATTGNTTMVTVVGLFGFNGTVALTCAITASPAGASDLPTCSLYPPSVTINSATAVSSTLTVNTTAPSTAANQRPEFFWPSAGGTALALLCFFVTHKRRRNWLAMLGLLVLFVAAGISACGGGGGGGGGPTNPGTTAGTYTITVTGTSGSETTTVGTITLKVT